MSERYLKYLSKDRGKYLSVSQANFHTAPDGASQRLISIMNKGGKVNVKREHLNIKLYLTDPFHTLVDMPWGRLLCLIVLVFLTSWTFFGLLFWMDPKGIAGTDFGHSFLNSFFFSVQTMSTIGYGDQHPKSAYINLIVCMQSMYGILLESTLVGLIFVKFSRPETRCGSILFSDVAVISKRDGKSCLMFRVLNVRKHLVVHPRLSVFYVSNQETLEGEKYMKFEKLALANLETPFLGLPWTVVHCIDEKSPLYERSLDALKEIDAEIVVILEGMDASSSGTFQSRYYYTPDDIRPGARFLDITSKGDDGVIHVDHAKFHDYETVLYNYQLRGSNGSNGSKENVSIVSAKKPKLESPKLEPLTETFEPFNN